MLAAVVVWCSFTPPPPPLVLHATHTMYYILLCGERLSILRNFFVASPSLNNLLHINLLFI